MYNKIIIVAILSIIDPKFIKNYWIIELIIIDHKFIKKHVGKLYYMKKQSNVRCFYLLCMADIQMRIFNPCIHLKKKVKSHMWILCILRNLNITVCVRVCLCVCVCACTQDFTPCSF